MKSIAGSCFHNIYMELLYYVMHQPYCAPAYMYEARSVEFALSSPMDNIVWNEVRGFNLTFAARFFQALINGSSDYSFLVDVNLNAENFVDKDSGLPPTNFSTAYGPRLVQQLPDIIGELLANPWTRRANIQILDSGDSKILVEKREETTKVEYPCVDSIFIHIRPGKEGAATLDFFVTVRSNNVVTTICYDVYNLTMLQAFIYQTLLTHGIEEIIESNLVMGKYNHYMVSAHVLDKDIELATSILKNSKIGLPMK